MRLETLKLDSLNPAKYNPRTITTDEFNGLCESLKTFGQQENLIVNKDMTIISGHQRYEAMKFLNWSEATCNVVDLDKHQEKKLNVIMNSDKISGKYDELKLAEILEELKLDEDYESLRLDKLEPLDLSPTEVEEDEAPEISQEPPVSKLGEIYQLGRHRVMCGDSVDLDDTDKLMDGVKAEMAFTDPPYLMGFEGNVHADGSKSFNAKHGAIKNDKMSRDDGDDFVYAIFETLATYVDGAYYVCFYRLGLDYIFRALDKIGNTYRSLIIWNKGNHTLSNSDYMSKYEPIVYGWFSKHNFVGGRSNFDIWDIDRTAKNELHPTMKPIELCAKAIQNSSDKNDVVLDLFLGSGSTLIACEQTDRICYGMELDPKYVDVIRKRYWKFTHDGNEEGWEEGTPSV